jgi:DNA-binding NarL/FixJ family response regulator
MSDKKYVAIVDDHAMIRKGLMPLINLFFGYEVLFDAANGQEFIDKIGLGVYPDIVLLDINMPLMDGYSTAIWIRKNLPLTYVLALSNMDSDAAIIRMIHCGARGYILKDEDPSELKRAFDEVIARGYYYNDIISRRVLQSVNELMNENSDLKALVKLTDRELEFIKLACSEKSYQKIASEMFVSERTVDGYRESLFKKLNVGTRVGLVIYAIKNKIVEI